MATTFCLGFSEVTVSAPLSTHQSGVSFTGLCDLAWQWLSDPMGNGSLPDDVLIGEAGKRDARGELIMSFDEHVLPDSDES